MSVVLVAVGGALGAVARLAAARLNGPRVAWGTLLVNLLGSLALGVLIGVDPSPEVAAGLATGFLGGLTTYSTLMVEVSMARPRRGAYLALSVVLGLAAAAAGVTMGKAM